MTNRNGSDLVVLGIEEEDKLARHSFHIYMCCYQFHVHILEYFIINLVPFNKNYMILLFSAPFTRNALISW